MDKIIQNFTTSHLHASSLEKSFSQDHKFYTPNPSQTTQ
uniref:Uncharacterized protein n=1 Tax=Rhizophora mucronata TaxID=61149 RepID=A0A2P2N1K4_RHIMU